MQNCPAVAIALFGVALLMGVGTAVQAQSGPPIWAGYGGNAQHTALSTVAAQPLQTVHWQTPIDKVLAGYQGGDLYIHYGAPLITAKNTVVVTLRTTANNTFQMQAYGGYAGELKWTYPTDYVTPPSGWIPSCGSVLSSDNSLYVPGAGGTIWHITNVDRPTVSATRLCFYGLSTYNKNASTYNSTVYIDTPITRDSAGNLYFGFQVTGANPTLSTGGLARITPAGVGTYVTAAAASGDSSMTKVANNCAPAISNDGSLVYVAVNSGVSNFGGGGYLVALNSTTLAQQGVVLLLDPESGQNADVIDDGTACPMVGPDDDVYYGVLETPFLENDDRGWLLHFNKQLTVTKTPGAFGWDDTASVVPAAAVPSYTGTSSYLILTKYNLYADFGTAPGTNRVAILDPNATTTDTYSGTPVTVMNEVISVLGITPNTAENLAGVREWCINSAVVDPITKCAIINSEDGNVYRWDFTTNSLSANPLNTNPLDTNTPPGFGVSLTAGIGEAYTPTVIGPDGTAYAINDAILFAVGSSSPDVTKAVSIYRYAYKTGAAPNTRTQLVKVTNVSGSKLPGPISLVLDNLKASVTLVNASGVTANATPLGSPYVTLTTGSLNNGASVTITLTFKNTPITAPITYSTRVVAGPGAP
jgi:hypothetical protein